MTQDEPVGQRLVQRPLVGQLFLDEVGPGLAIAVGDRHAARVVDDDAQEVLLGHGGAQDERRAEQADDEHGQHAEPDRHEHQTLARGPFVRDGPVRDEGGGGERGKPQDDERHRPRGGEREVALLKNDARILEEKLEQPAHGCVRPAKSSFYPHASTF